MLLDINEEVLQRQSAIDWYWSRAAKGGTAVPSNIATYATTLYSEQNTKETAVNNITTLNEVISYEATPYTKTMKTPTYNADGSFDAYVGTNTYAVTINECRHFTANPTDEVDPAFVSLVAD